MRSNSDSEIDGDVGLGWILVNKLDCREKSSIFGFFGRILGLFFFAKKSNA